MAYLDGEIDAAGRSDLEQHLSTCWHCRAKLSALQDRIDEVARASKDFQLARGVDIGRTIFPGILADRRPEKPRPSWSPKWLIPAFGVVGLSVVLSLHFPVPPPSPVQQTRVNRTAIERSEDFKVGSNILHQRFAVDFVSPNRSERRKLEVWDHAASSRSALKLIRDDGAYVHARWQQGGDLLAERSSPLRKINLPSECKTLSDLESIAVGLLRAHPSGRLRLATGLLRELERRGFRLNAQPSNQAGIWRLEASSPKDRAWLELDSRSLRPYLFALASSDEKRTWRIVFRLEAEEQKESELVPASVFQPEAEVMAPSELVATKLEEPKSTPLATPLEPLSAEMELRILAFAARWRMEGEEVKALDSPAFSIQAKVKSDERRIELERLFETWPLLSFRIESQSLVHEAGSWCGATLIAASESRQQAWFLSRLQMPRYASLEATAAKLHETFASEAQAAFDESVARLDGALRPIRGSASAALTVISNKNLALDRLHTLLKAACDSHPGGPLERLTATQRNELLALLAAAQQFQWTMPSTPSRNEP